MRRKLAAGLFAALLLVLTLQRPPHILAHAVLVRSDPAANAKLPAPPKVISLYFSEPLEPRFSTARVVDSGGGRLDQNDSRIDAGDPTHMTVDLKPLKPGFYSVLWTTVSKVDGHKLEGSFPFIVLNADGTTPSGAPPAAAAGSGGDIAGTASTGPVDAVAYWLAIAGAVALFGGALFALAVALPAAAVLGEDAEQARVAVVRLAMRVLWVALAVFLIGGLAVVSLQVRQLGGAASIGQFLETTYGQYWLARLVLALVVAAALIVLGRLRDPSARVPLLSLAALCAFGILACSSVTSHGAAVGNGSFWAVIADLLHLSMVGVWVGGLVSLGLTLRYALRTQAKVARVRYHAAVVGRFSAIASSAVALILLSGIFNAVVEIPSTGGLIHTTYGRSLLIKLALIVPLLAVGGVNAFLLRPRLVEKAGEPGAAADAARLDLRLRRTVLAEAGLGLLVLLVVGFLLIVPPSRSLTNQTAAAAPLANGSSVYNNTAMAADLSVQLTVTPNKVGENSFRVRLSDVQGPVADASLVRLDMTFADPKFGISHLELPTSGNGVYEATGANFAQVGRWQVTVVVRRAGKDDALTSFTVELPDAAGNLTINRRAATDPFASPSRLFSTDQLGGVVLVLGGLLPLTLRRRLWHLGAPAGAAGTLLGVGALMAGGALFFAAHNEGTTDYTLLPNPVPVNNETVAEGKTLFLQNCTVCHGQTGHGDGPAAQGLNPKPFDLTVHVGLHADGVLWGWISYGIPRTAMPPWKDKLTDTQRWQIVNFMRTSFQSNGAQLPPPSVDPSPGTAARAWAVLLAGESDANP